MSSELPSQEEYEKVKNTHKEAVRALEKRIQTDVVAVAKDFAPRYLREKFVISCAIFGGTYLLEEMIFRKSVPGIVKFVGALSTTVLSPKIYRFAYRNYFTPAAPSEQTLIPPDAEQPHAFDTVETT